MKHIMADNNSIGLRCESIFTTRITQWNVFNVYFLGDKTPVVDFLVEINDANTPYAFVVQVKSTIRGYNTAGDLKVRVTRDKYMSLLKRPLPTYVAGVDINTETVYLCPAFNDKTCVKSLPAKNKLKFTSPATTKRVLALLKNDVIKYWQNAKTIGYKKKYTSIL